MKQKNSTYEDFAADLAHEFRNPLASIRSAVETLRLSDDPSIKTKLLDVMQHDVARLDRLVSDLSVASQLDAGLTLEKSEYFDLFQMLDRIVAQHRYNYMSKGVSLRFDPPETGMMICGLEARLEQVMHNLLENAFSFSPANAEIVIDVSKNKNRVELAVRDAGPGVSERSLERIFERFYTARPQASFGENSGLGLSISRQIIEAHGGTISASNNPTSGACFTVILPS